VSCRLGSHRHLTGPVERSSAPRRAVTSACPRRLDAQRDNDAPSLIGFHRPSRACDARSVMCMAER
jgi:hypothetical protein